MAQTRSSLVGLALAIGLAAAVIVLLLLATWAYTTFQLDRAKAQGVYSSAEDAMLALIDRTYQESEDVQIIYVGTNSFDGSDPHIWYAIACVWGGTRRDGSPVGSAQHAYDQPGTYFLATPDGWVWMPEGALPEFVGYWMKAFGLAGPGSSTPSHEWGDNPDKGCIF